MRSRVLLSTAAFVVAAGVALSPAAPALARDARTPRPAIHTILRPDCALAARAGFSHCNLRLLGNGNGRPLAAAAPSGYGPADLQSAYALPSGSAGSGQTVAIVDAYDDTTAVADVSAYRNQYGLGGCQTVATTGCTFTNGATIRKVNQNGVQGSYPANNQSWAVEISLDVDMVSAACPKCNILLVEATSNSNANLYTAVDTAARMGANAISNSYGGSEASTETTDDAHFNHPGVAITVSSGDSGYGVEYPAASRYVTAVGGTSLSHASNARGWSEAAWSGAGSGCSAYEGKQAWQTDGGCARRTVADVSAVADPNTGVAVYDTDCTGINKLIGNCFSGWGTVGGTSVSSPIIGAVYALAGNAGSVTYGSYPYSHTGSLNDVTTGNNGSCSGSYLCTAGSGYDGPTGLGTPNGTGAF
jgi:subtilase family serine protease